MNFYWHFGDEKFARKKFAQEFWIGFHHQWMMGFLQKEKTRIVDCVCVFLGLLLSVE
jgi:hypothetical protein